jgi:hypothetical protein
VRRNKRSKYPAPRSGGQNYLPYLLEAASAESCDVPFRAYLVKTIPGQVSRKQDGLAVGKELTQSQLHLSASISASRTVHAVTVFVNATHCGKPPLVRGAAKVGNPAQTYDNHLCTHGLVFGIALVTAISLSI